MKNTVKGAVIASAVWATFSAGAVNAAEGKATKDTGKEVKCAGINECKGKGACAGAGHSCAGKNDCKGQGWTKVGTEKECTDKGGKVMAAK